jgi:chromosome partitioning protein
MLLKPYKHTSFVLNLYDCGWFSFKEQGYGQVKIGKRRVYNWYFLCKNGNGRVIEIGTVITIANNKGGVAKTTTVCELGYSMCMAGEKVLVIDVDGQGNATRNFGLFRSDYKINMYNLLEDQIRMMLGSGTQYCVKDAVTKTRYGVDLIPCDAKISAIPTWLQDNGSMFKTGSEIEHYWRNDFPVFLSNIIREVKDDYTRIIIDTPPALEYCTTAALIASDYVIIPVELGDLELIGLDRLFSRIKQLKNEYGNPAILGIVVNRYEGGRTGARTIVGRDLETELREDKTYGNLVFGAVIYKSASVREAGIKGMLVSAYQKKKARSVFENFHNLMEEVEMRLQAAAAKHD